MAIKDHLTRVAKQRAYVSEVDTANNTVDVITNTGPLRIKVWEVPPSFRWPQPTETWSIYEENGYWYLGSRIHDPTDTKPIKAMAPGDQRLDASIIFDALGRRVITGDIASIVDGQTLSWDAAKKAFVPHFTSGQGVAFVQSIGDGANRVFNITHGMNTTAVVAKVMTTALPRSEVTAEIEYPDPNTVTVRTRATDAPPTAAQYTVVISGPGSVPMQNVGMDIWHDFSGVGGVGGFYNTSFNYDTNTTSPGVGPSFRNVGYRKQPNGRVDLRGVMKCGVSGAVVLTVPPDYAPPKDRSFIAEASGGHANIVVRTNGNIEAWNQTGTVTIWVFLDGISWDTESVTSFPAIQPNLVPVVSALPTLGVDGQEVDLEVDTAGLYGGPFLWRCKYRASWPAPYRWQVIGPSPLRSYVAANIGIAANAWVDGASLGPDMTVPFAGIWDVSFGFSGNASSTGGYAWMALGFGAGWTTPVTMPNGLWDATAAATKYGGNTEDRIVVSAANTLLRARYQSRSTTQTAAFQDREIFATPLKLAA